MAALAGFPVAAGVTVLARLADWLKGCPALLMDQAAVTPTNVVFAFYFARFKHAMDLRAIAACLAHSTTPIAVVCD